MDIHRSRFVPYPIHAITAVAFSQDSNDNLQPGQPQPDLKLALGRQNGDIELWNPLQGSWVQEAVFPGDNKSIDGLAWTRDPDETDLEGHTILGQHRLFSIASSATVTEWNLGLGQPKRHSTGNFSEVWCLAAQPRQQTQPADHTGEPHFQDLVAGCGDGTIVLLSTADDDLQFKRFLARVGGRKAKCVSISYQNRTRVLAGFMDSTIRVYDTKSVSLVRTMSLGVGIPGAPKDAVVWQVKALPNGDIVSGDSNGELVFWDGRSYSLTQRIRGHDSECLDVVASADGKTVFSGSMDGRIATYRQSTNSMGRKSWAKIHHRKTHNGEVKSMSAFDSKGLSVVVSGGDDLAPIVTPLRENGKEHVRALSAMPQATPVTGARHARLFASWWDKSISIWRIARKPSIKLTTDSQPPRKMVGKLVLSGRDTVRSVAMSEDGRMIAACTNSDIKVFQLRRRPDAEMLGIRKIAIPSALSGSGARLVNFSPDGKWLAVVTMENDIHVARITIDPSHPKHIRIVGKVAELERRGRKGALSSGFDRYSRSISRMAFADDGSILVVADWRGYLDSWVLEGNEDLTAPEVDVSQGDAEDGGSRGSSSVDSDSSDDEDEVLVFHGQHWRDNPAGHLLPKLDSTPLVLSFRPTASKSQTNGNPGMHSTRHNPHAHSHDLPNTDHHLWVMTAQHQMYEFDILAGKLTDWSRRHPPTSLPDDFTRIKDRVLGALWDIRPSHQRLWLYGPSWLFMLNLATDPAPAPRKKRRTESSSAPAPPGKRPKLSSGAGDRKPASDPDAQPPSVHRYADGAWSELPLEDPLDADADAEAGADEEDALLAFARVRGEEGVEDGDAEGEVPSHRADKQRRWYYVFKYRPILGVVPLEQDGDEAAPLEVVLVERPLWEAREER